jgi:hypothetical protein
MTNSFRPCTLPWSIWSWGLTLKHSDTDVLPECSVEFGAMRVVQTSEQFEQIWIRVDFADAAYASAKPHRDDEEVFTVTGYKLIQPDVRTGSEGIGLLDEFEQEQEEWKRTGICRRPDFYFSRDSRWLEAERDSWAWRHRGGSRPEDAVHFLLDGRDGYLEILASGFHWSAWHTGSPMLSNVSGDPIASGLWID